MLRLRRTNKESSLLQVLTGCMEDVEDLAENIDRHNYEGK